MQLSIIIPTLNEAGNLETALSSTRCDGLPELIVVDGGSTDQTVEIALSFGSRVLTTSRGRAVQMNKGAAEATGDVLLFLHADSVLPVGFYEHVRQTLACPITVAGAFQLRIDDPHWGLRCVEWMANWRSRRLHLPFGDQGIFLTTKLFRELGGFPDIPIMEDMAMMSLLRKRGRITITRVAVVTSARRWKKEGVFRATMTNQVAMMAYWVGVRPTRIWKWYASDYGYGRHHAGGSLTER